MENDDIKTSEEVENQPTLQEFAAKLLESQDDENKAVLKLYREQDELDSDSDTDSDESDIVIQPASLDEEATEDDPKVKKFGPTAKGELTLDDLPAVEKLKITVPSDHLQYVGDVYSFVDRLVLVEAEKGDLVLNLDTVLFLEDGRAVGQVFDVIGQVKKPYYVLRFNNQQEIADEHLEKGVKIFCAPTHADYTFFVFEKQLKEMMSLKGSDASWEHDVEPPQHELEYSDDEQEREAKKERRAKRQANSNSLEKPINKPKREYKPPIQRNQNQDPPQYQIPPQHPAYRTVPPTFHAGVPPPGYNPWARPSMTPLRPPPFGSPFAPPPYAYPPVYIPPYGPPPSSLHAPLGPPIPYPPYQTRPNW